MDDVQWSNIENIKKFFYKKTLIDQLIVHLQFQFETFFCT